MSHSRVCQRMGRTFTGSGGAGSDKNATSAGSPVGFRTDWPPLRVCRSRSGRIGHLCGFAGRVPGGLATSADGPAAEVAKRTGNASPADGPAAEVAKRTENGAARPVVPCPDFSVPLETVARPEGQRPAPNENVVYLSKLLRTAVCPMVSSLPFALPSLYL